MVFFITMCRLLSWLAWYEHRQQFSSSLSSAPDLSAVPRESLDSGRQWMVHPAACATMALWSVCAGQHSQGEDWCAVQRATCLGIKDEPSRPVIVEHLSTTAACQCHTWTADQATALTGYFVIDSHGKRRIHGFSFGRQASPRRQVCAQCGHQDSGSNAGHSPDRSAFCQAPSPTGGLAKKRIMLLKHVGARIDACRQALVRATKRQSEAQETLRLATVTLEKANTEVTTLAENLSQLEAAVALSEEGPNSSLAECTGDHAPMTSTWERKG